MKTIYGAMSLPQTRFRGTTRSHLDDWFMNLSDEQKRAIFDREVKNAKAGVGLSGKVAEIAGRN